VAYQADELHALVSLEAHRAGAVVVGEDLGTVPDGVHRRMAADGMLRSWVFQFESSAAEPLPEPPAAALASMGTHDLPRFATYFGGGDIEEDARAGRMTPAQAGHRQADRAGWRQSLLRALDLPQGGGEGGGEGGGDGGGCDEEARLALQGCLERLAASAAQLVLVDLEELWGETEPQNRPGTGTEAGNWRRRAARTLNEARADAVLNDVLAGIGRLREAPTT
jgi:4-alpha-glucanotransferase